MRRATLPVGTNILSIQKYNHATCRDKVTIISLQT